MSRKLVCASIFGLILSAVIADEIIKDQTIYRDRSLDARYPQQSHQFAFDRNRRSKSLIGLHQSAIMTNKASVMPIYNNGLDYVNVIPPPIFNPAVRDPTVIVNVPNNELSRYGSVGNRYGMPVTPYNTASPTVVVNVPDNEYDSMYRGGYSGTNIFGGQRRY